MLITDVASSIKLQLAVKFVRSDDFATYSLQKSRQIKPTTE